MRAGQITVNGLYWYREPGCRDTTMVELWVYESDDWSGGTFRRGYTLGSDMEHEFKDEDGWFLGPVTPPAPPA